MPRVRFTQNLQRHVHAPEVATDGATVREALEAVFREHSRLRGYILDDRNRLRKHITVFVDGDRIRDRDGLSDSVEADSEILVMQALSGG